MVTTLTASEHTGAARIKSFRFTNAHLSACGPWVIVQALVFEFSIEAIRRWLLSTDIFRFRKVFDLECRLASIHNGQQIIAFAEQKARLINVKIFMAD
jgi:hypothetical protein